MSMRKDAAKAMFDFVQGFNDFCGANAGNETVWAFTEVRTEPQAGNVIANLAQCSIQFRDISVEILNKLDEGVEQVCQQAARANELEFSTEKTVTLAPTAIQEQIVTAIELAANELEVSLRRMPSGAGHDAMVIGRYIPAGMLFIPSIGGLSHDTEENTSEEDIRRGAEVFAAAISKLIDKEMH